MKRRGTRSPVALPQYVDIRTVRNFSSRLLSLCSSYLVLLVVLLAAGFICIDVQPRTNTLEEVAFFVLGIILVELHARTPRDFAASARSTIITSASMYIGFVL